MVPVSDFCEQCGWNITFKSCECTVTVRRRVYTTTETSIGFSNPAPSETVMYRIPKTDYRKDVTHKQFHHMNRHERRLFCKFNPGNHNCAPRQVL